jgi:putative tricarboxylic transport membrane protein
MNDVITSAAGVIFSLIFLYSSLKLPSEIRNYPAVLLVFLLIFSSIIGAKALKKGCFSKSRVPNDSAGLSKKVLTGLSMFACYIIAINILGYILSSILFVFLWTSLLGNISIVKRLALSAFCVVFLMLIFGKFLGVPLPEGIITTLL